MEMHDELTVTAPQSLAPMNDADLWQRYATALAAQVTSGQFDPNNQVICFASDTLVVDLADADAEISNYNIYTIGNLIPKWSPAYAPGSDLIGSYSSFLNYINLGGDPNPNLDSQINIAAGNLTAANLNFQAQLTASLTGWANAKTAMPTLTWVQYIQQFGAVYTEAKAAVDSAQVAYQNLLQQKSGVDFQSLLNAQSRVGFTGGARDTVTANQYNMEAKVGAQAPLGSTTVLPGQTPAAPSSSLTEILLAAYDLDGFTTKYQEWQTNSINNQTGATISVSGTSVASQFSDYGWSASLDASVFGDFFSLFASGSASGETIKTSWQSTNFGLTVSFTGLGSFNIGATSWFQPSFIQMYRDKLYAGAPSFFGENGALSLVPYQLIVGFEPSITLTLNNQDYQDVKTSFQAQASASIGIGPFRIGTASYSTYGSKNDMQYNDATNTITMGPIKSTLPLLLGVICSKM